MALVEIHAPAEQTEGTRSQVLRWLKNVGDSVAEHEPLIEIETDKVTVEVPAPASGVLREILKGEQEEVEPGTVLGRLELSTADGTSAKATATSQTSTPAAAPAKSRDDESTSARATVNLSPAVRRLIAERGLDPLRIRGSGDGGRITVDDVLAYKGSTDSPLPGGAGSSVKGGAASSLPSGDASSSDASSSFPSGVSPSLPIGAGSSVKGGAASPLPSGDAKAVASFAAGHAETKSPSANSANKHPSTSAPSSSSSVDSGLPSHAVPHTAIRKRTAAHMVQSLLQTSPHVTTVFEADLSTVAAHRASHRAEFDSKGAPLTFTAYFIAASVAGIRAVPEANARWTDQATEIYDTINIGVATALPEVGLVVPVLHNLAHKSLFEIAKALNERVTAARAGKLQPADVRGGTFTISNHGVSGSLLAAPIIINQPQSAILGIGKLEKRPVVIEKDGQDQIVIRPKCYVTLTIDHRVMDGHQANRFLQVFVETLEHWAP